NNINYSMNILDFDIMFINDGASSYYRKLFFEKTSYTKQIEKNIIYYGLNEDRNNIKISDNNKELNPLAYGLIFIYNINNKQEFQEKFNTIDKYQKRIDFDSVLELENRNDNLINGLTIKEIL